MSSNVLVKPSESQQRHEEKVRAFMNIGQLVRDDEPRYGKGKRDAS